MSNILLEEIHLIGAALKTKTSNAGKQSAVDCGNLWQKFEKEDYVHRIPGKINQAVLAVYHEYEGDHTKPFAYFIGCQVSKDASVPDGMDRLTISRNTYRKLTARGKMPDCVADIWEEIWQSNIPRSFQADFEVYDERSKDWNNAEVDVFLSVH